MGTGIICEGCLKEFQKGETAYFFEYEQSDGFEDCDTFCEDCCQPDNASSQETY